MPTTLADMQQDTDKPTTGGAYAAYQQDRRAHWDEVAGAIDRRRSMSLGRLYRRRMKQVYRFITPPGQRVLEIGCGQGDLLASLDPELGIGVDFSSKMVTRAKERHPGLTFIEADAHEFELPNDVEADGPFDVVILSDLVDDLWDVQAVLARVARYCGPQTRVVINTYSRVWQLPLRVARTLGMATPVREQNWIAPDDVRNLLELAGFQVLRQWTEIIWPVWLPLIAGFCNRFLARLWPFRFFALTNLFVARLSPEAIELPTRPIVSVIVPARNEAGNIQRIIDETPELAGGTELIFVEGGSSDDTWERIQTLTADCGRRVKIMQQTGKGKGDAVRLGFDRAEGDIFLILDADLTVSPDDLPRFIDVLTSGQGEFVNGVRLVYPMEGQAMRFLNLLGNKFFSLAFTWLLGQPVKDTLCGTKVLWREDYERIVANRAYFGEFDPYGDFDLIFGAAKLNRKIVDMPVRYRARTYGDTNINRWQGGALLLRMTMVAARRLKFV